MMLAERIPFIGRRIEDLPVETGRRFRHVGSDSTVETAHVLAVRDDWMGIPHVCFNVTIERGQGPRVEGMRTLNLQSFVEYFRDPVEEAEPLNASSG